MSPIAATTAFRSSTRTENLLEIYKQYSRISGLFITDDDTLYAIDSESRSGNHPGWLTGVRIGPAGEDRLTGFVPPHAHEDAVCYKGLRVRVLRSTRTATSMRRKAQGRGQPPVVGSPSSSDGKGYPAAAFRSVGANPRVTSGCTVSWLAHGSRK